MAYADYEYYTTTYLGTAIQEADFPRLSLRASSFLDYYTQSRAVQNKNLDALKIQRGLFAKRPATLEANVWHCHDFAEASRQLLPYNRNSHQSGKGDAHQIDSDMYVLQTFPALPIPTYY